MNVGSGIMEIAMALIGVALLALLIGNSKKTVEVISQAGNTFDSLLRTVTLQNAGGFSQQMAF